MTPQTAPSMPDHLAAFGALASAPAALDLPRPAATQSPAEERCSETMDLLLLLASFERKTAA